MREILADAERWQARGERFALATVVATRRSAPRPVGSKLAVSDSGEMAGSVSGGCVENDVYEHAKQVLAGAPPQLVTYGISDELALSVGLPCGGEIDVFVEEADPALVGRIRALLEHGERAVLFTVVEGEGVGTRSLSTDERTQLVDDTDRNVGNILIDKDWKIYLIDFTRAFRRPHELRAPQLLQRCDKNLLARLRDLKVEDVKARISKWVPPREIESMMARRDALVALYDKLIAERGEARVLF